ncbi:hypothetical protein PTTG_28740 [Puccinia triticina 1-1 BBBD Race 1]|uniref:Uncharacterized protein n=2 Tax=Puccinia triticina TaxID=208348 RepID=A0A180G9A9_PUCT1|nr:uncharacterized protein PtA15_13A105 [Puccinia triticina]OAV89295.1 hypothetical protein PTTG_28740 [Puccinia triticina 1-1 BBBD Race 1]WAQ90706.1 hypothetical protein PtA15_13A105 [Puccinia triticina]WAR60894.1 hypothetical protein PtB15_13B143 [Puccinia triticina]
MFYAVPLNALLLAITWQHSLVNSTPMCSLETSLPQLQARQISEVDIINEQTLCGIHDEFSKSSKRLILLDNDGTLKPRDWSNSPTHHARVHKALRRLTDDLKNEVWIITAAKLPVLEELYGDISKLNLAGHKGAQISTTTRSQKNLGPPAAKRIDLLAEEARAIYSEFASQLDILLASKFKDYEGIYDYRSSDKSKLTLRYKAFYSKGVLAKARLEGIDSTSDFGISIGDLEMDEAMHVEMKKKGFPSIIVQDTAQQDIKSNEKHGSTSN